MSKFLKSFYYILTGLFVLLTAYEVYMYMTMDSNYLGIFYLFFNFFVMFLMFTVSYNYDESNRSIRVSKNIIALIIGVIASFVLSLLLPYMFNYKDDSFLFMKSIFIISKIIKPIIYLLLGVLSFYEIRLTKTKN